MAGLLKRLKDVISAESHDILDAHESPDKIARQLVRDVSDKVSAAQKLTIDAVASEKQLAKQLNEHSTRCEHAQKAAEAALKAEDELGARRALEEKLHHQKLVETLTPQLEAAESNSCKLKQQLSSLQQQMTSLKSEKLVIEARFNGAKATDEIEQMNNDISISDDTQSRLDRAHSMVSAMESRNEAVAEVNNAIAPQLSDNNDINVDLEMEKLRKDISG